MNNNDFDFFLTDAEVEFFNEATPQEIAQAVGKATAQLVRDPEFWKRIARAFFAGFVRGLNRV